jgi:hypothetical protein
LSLALPLRFFPSLNLALFQDGTADAPEPKRKRRKGEPKKFGPCRDALLAFGLERAGAIQDSRVRWKAVQAEYFQTLKYQDLKKRLDAVQRSVKKATNPLMWFHLTRQEYHRRCKEMSLEDKLDFVRREVQLIDAQTWEGELCSGCHGGVSGTKFMCGECPGFTYCSNCVGIDPVGHGGSHWRESSKPCSICERAGIASNGRNVYCETCFEADAGGFVAGQFGFKHRPVSPEALKKMRSALGATDTQLKRWISGFRFP